MIWFANILLLLSMYLLGRRAFRAGWSISVVGNAIWVVVTAMRHQWDYSSLSMAFVLIASYNLVKAIRNWSEPRQYFRDL